MRLNLMQEMLDRQEWKRLAPRCRYNLFLDRILRVDQELGQELVIMKEG